MDAGVASPVRRVIHTQVSGSVLGVLGGEVAVGNAPHSLGVADADTVVGGGHIQVALAGVDVIAALSGGDRPAQAGAFIGGQRGAIDGAGLVGQGLALTAFSGIGQHPGGALLGHGDRDGIRRLDIRQLHLRPGGGACSENGCRQHGDDHGQQQQRRKHLFRAFSSHLAPPLPAWGQIVPMCFHGYVHCSIGT